MDDAFKFIEKNQGLTTETNYPYEGSDGTCNKNEEANHAAKITGYEGVPENSESALLNAVASQPISIAIDAGGFDFQFYSSGVFTGQCSTELLAMGPLMTGLNTGQLRTHEARHGVKKYT